MKGRIALFAGMLALASARFAAAEPLENAVEARGTPSCGEWIAHRKESDTLALSNTSWLVGYLSGLAAGAGKNFLPGSDNSAIFSWMDNYCRSYPLKDVGSGGARLMAELMAKKGSNR